MNAFTNGALSALNSIKKQLIDSLEEGALLEAIVGLIDSYIALYKVMEREPLSKAKVIEELNKIDEMIEEGKERKLWLPKALLKIM